MSSEKKTVDAKKGTNGDSSAIGIGINTPGAVPQVGDNPAAPVFVDFFKEAKEKQQKGKVALLEMDSLFRNPTNETEVAIRRLMIDGNADDTKLHKLIESYFQITDDESEEQEPCTKGFKQFLENVDQVRLGVQRTCLAIEINTKASTYWDELSETIRNDMNELRVLIESNKDKIAERDLKKRQCFEKEAVLRTLSGMRERHQLEEEISNLRKSLKELMGLEEEEDQLIRQKSVYLHRICELASRLTSDNEEVVLAAVAEVEEKELSDVSMDVD